MIPTDMIFPLDHDGHCLRSLRVGPMSGITERSMELLLKSIRDSFQVDVYRAHVRAETRRVAPSATELLPPTIQQPPYVALKAARDLLEKHGFTVVPNHRIACIDATHRFDWRELEVVKDTNRLIESVLGSLAAQLGSNLVEQGGSIQHDRTGVCERIIGHTTTVILPK